MRKFTDFIINKRHLILILFIILSIISGILSQKVNINYDIAEYLPSTSETRIGMNIMEREFKEIKSSSLNLMFEDLQEDKKTEIYSELIQINGVSSVDYDNTENYNKENYTLYVIHVDDTEDSKLASDVYKEITKNYKDYKIYTDGDIAERNKPVLSIWIVVLAVVCAMIILIVMCESYVEPFLFLTSILIAVVLNNGTNIIFGTVSNITSSISAILQMALSMDYSIMLMNRYAQEREKEEDKVKAMKNALYNAFKSISSSSVTTIVGLLALVFMSFTIGRDLGFVLAKGVLFSLISIFFVLPGLILMFDKWIAKTKKKSPNFKMDGLGKISYKVRYVALVLFLIAFVGSYIVKGNLGISYTDTTSNEINKVFSENNQIALIYNSKDEEIVAKYLKEIENQDKVEEVLGYGNTINEELHFNELNQQLKDLGSDVEVEEYLIKILYYNYYNKNEDNKMTFSEFTNFINQEVYQNPKISEKLDNGTRKDIDRLGNFTNANSINQKRTASEIANILEIDESQIKDILIYYNSKNNDLKLSLNEFIHFMNQDVLTNPNYAKSVDVNSRENLNTLSKFTNKNTITKKMTSKEMANLFGMPEATMNSLYTYYISVNEIESKMTINEFSNFVLTDVLTNSQYANLFDEATVNQIKMLATFSDKGIITKNMNATELSNLFGIDENLIKQLLLLKYSNIENVQNDTNSWQMTPNELVQFIIANSENEAIKNNMDAATMEKLQLLAKVMNSSINNQAYSYQELATLIGTDSNTIKNIYTLYVSQKTNTKLTPQEFVNFVLNHKNDATLASSINASTTNQLKLVQTVMKGTINNTKYSNTELSNLLGIQADNLNLLYGLYQTKYISPNQTISLRELVSFLINDVMKNPDYASNFDTDTSSKLNTINGIMSASLNNTKYTKEEIFAILSKLSDGLDKNTVDLIYMYYGSNHAYDESWTLTVEKFVNYLNDNILQDSRFNDFIENDMRQNITDAKELVNEAKDLLIGNHYSRVVINTKLEPESEETFRLIQKIKDELGRKLDEFYIIGNSPMAYEMSQTFQEELDFITILTMIAIFVVVAITFKSILIPLILVLTIQCAVFMTMGILSFTGEKVYFIALLIVQSILMGATIDYAILYTSYYIEHRKSMNIKDSIINSYNKAIHTILTSASILIIVTLVVGNFASAIAAKICKTISQGTLCSAILILVLLPAVLAACDKIIIKKKQK